jgi:hypothetical protein
MILCFDVNQPKNVSFQLNISTREIVSLFPSHQLLETSHKREKTPPDTQNPGRCPCKIHQVSNVACRERFPRDGKFLDLVANATKYESKKGRDTNLFLARKWMMANTDALTADMDPVKSA